MKSLLSLLVVLLLAGCATPNQSTTTLTPFDSGHKITVAVGQILVVELPSNRTTGYRWNERSEGEPVLALTGEPAYLLRSVPMATPAMVGTGGTEVWRFRATKVGQQTLRLDYARSWEKDVAPAKTVSFDVLVTDGGH